MTWVAPRGLKWAIRTIFILLVLIPVVIFWAWVLLPMSVAVLLSSLFTYLMFLFASLVWLMVLGAQIDKHEKAAKRGTS